MRLELEDGTVFDQPTAEVIEQALRGLHGSSSTFRSNSYAILSRTDGAFIQVAGDATEGFGIEYREGPDGEQFTGADGASFEEAVAAFQAYAAGDDSWREQFDWQPARSGCFGLFVLVIGLGTAAATAAAGLAS